MADDNNWTGNLCMLSANPWVGLGRDAATGLPTGASVLYGYAASTLVGIVDAPTGSLALNADGTAFFKAAPGVGNWTALPVGDAANRSLDGAALYTVSNPNNVYPVDLFGDFGTPTFNVLSTARYEVTLTMSCQRTGAIAGTALQQSIFARATVGGTGNPVGELWAVAAAADGFGTTYTFRQELDLNANDALGFDFGFGGAQATGVLNVSKRLLTARAVRS